MDFPMSPRTTSHRTARAADTAHGPLVSGDGPDRSDVMPAELPVLASSARHALSSTCTSRHRQRTAIDPGGADDAMVIVLASESLLGRHAAWEHRMQMLPSCLHLPVC